ncbi:MAG: hypothetical protein KGL52_00290 [Rhodospirillales bacterium]|jgi:hypothetical protein|nr:hypothetical protein [Rhodospirillales bacterium]
MSTRELRVLSGAVIASRFFDVADTIDLAKAETLWAQQPRSGLSRGRLVSTPPKAVAFGVPPLDIPLARVALQLDGVMVEADPTVRLFDFGVARLAVRVAVDDLSFAAFTRRLIAVDRCIGPAAGAALWQELLDHVRSLFAAAFLRASRPALEEDYLIGFVRSFDETPGAEELQQRIDLVPLLSGEERPLSEGARRDLLRQRFSYYSDDLVVLTWDRAFIYEPRGDSDVIDVLDVANAQLLEMRYYDGLLDQELPRIYDVVEETRRTRPLLSSRRFANLARRLYGLVAEVTELREKVDNALQVTEDVYLARIYTAALDLFRVAAVSASVDRKLAIIRDTYAALYEEASSSRAALMEATIVILILIEIILALVRP